MKLAPNYAIVLERDYAAEQREANEYFKKLEADELAAAPELNRLAQAGGEAFNRLLDLAERRDSGQIARVVSFLAALYNGESYAFNISDLRLLDESIRKDMLSVLQTQRGLSDYAFNLPGVINGENRVVNIIAKWKPCRLLVE